MAVDNILLMTLNNTTIDQEIASQITMLIECYVHGIPNTLTMFCNSEHVADKLMAKHHSNILDILDERFPHCFSNSIEDTSSSSSSSRTDIKADTSEDALIYFSDFNFSTDNILKMVQKADRPSPVRECNISYDELLQYMNVPIEKEADIPWLTNFQIRAESIAGSKKFKMSASIEEHNYTTVKNFNRSSSELTDIMDDLQNDMYTESEENSTTDTKATVEVTNSTLKRRYNQISKEPSKVDVPEQIVMDDERPEGSITTCSQDFCYKCHLVISNKKQYSCMKCNRSYHKQCFAINDLICLDCNISNKYIYEDQETLAMILNYTMTKVLNYEESVNLSRLRCSVNLYFILLKVETGKYKSIPEFVEDFNCILHFCSINPKMSHLKQQAENVLEIVLKELRRITVRMGTWKG
ncbi:unnamed protein product [Diamesa serratosioi]